MITTGNWTTVKQRNAELAGKLRSLMAHPDRSSPIKGQGVKFSRTFAKSIYRELQEATTIVTHIEVNGRHGVGILIGRLFANHPNIICIRSRDYHGGDNDLGEISLCVSHGDVSSDITYRNVLSALGGSTVGRVLCIPYFPDDVLTATAIKELFGVPLCTYIMDDQNLYADGISDGLMRRLLEKSSLRLGISTELCRSYEAKYNCRVWWMPPLVLEKHVQTDARLPATARNDHGVIIGNIWGQRWLELLRETVRGSGITLSWYITGDHSALPCSREQLRIDGITLHESLPDEPLIAILREAKFAVVPSGPLDDTDDRRFIAQLSLPSRIPYILATANTPIIVLGSKDTAAARFVLREKIGVVCAYERIAFRATVEQMCEPAANLAYRKTALAAAHRFIDRDAAEWIWQSLAQGSPIDNRFDGGTDEDAS